MPDVYLHIGVHKTGTTSVQAYLHDHAHWLLQQHVFVPALSASVGLQSHFGLNVYGLDDDRLSPTKLRLLENPGFDLADYRNHVADAVSNALQSRGNAPIVFTNEGLSLLRTKSELARLAALFNGLSVHVIVYTRDPTAYLRSYEAHLRSYGYPISDDPATPFYVAEDSWLRDWDSLVGIYRSQFDSISALNYDKIVQRDGDVIPSFLDQLNCSRTGRPPSGGYRHNTTSQSD